MRSTAALCRHLTTDRRADGELLAAFVAGPSEDAFAELVRRHGPLVWSACRRLLPDPTDAEDAFQATFLILVRRARGLTSAPALGPWLHQVAALTARGIRRKNARRLAHRAVLTDHVRDPARPADADLKADLDAALLALPAHYRDPIILCHLQGFSRREAAERLGCPEGTLSAWLNRGLEKLRHRLRGLNPTPIMTVATAGVPAALTTSTARAAVATAVAAAGAPPTVSLLVEGVIHMFWIKKATAAAFALSAVFALGIGAGLSTRTEYTGAGAEDKAADPKAKDESGADFTKEIAALEAAIREKAKSHETLADGTRGAFRKAELLKEFVNLVKKSQSSDQDAIRAARDFEDALHEYSQLRKLKDQAAGELKELNLRLAQLKGNAGVAPRADAPAGPPKKLTEEIAWLMDERRKLMDALESEQKPVLEKKRKVNVINARLSELLPEQAKYQEEVPADPAQIAKSIADLEEEVRRLEQNHLSAQASVQAAAHRFELTKKTGAGGKELLDDQITLARFRDELETATTRLEDARDRLAKLKRAAVKAETYLELTVDRKGNAYGFVLWEVPVKGGPARPALGPVTTGDVTMLGVLLARAKHDPNGPQEVHLIAEPQTVMSLYPQAALEACDTAGYKTVKFTGYIFGGRPAAELKPDQKGDVAGYKRYDMAEVQPKELAKEIEKNMPHY